MKKEYYEITSNELVLKGITWKCEVEPKAIILIVHGMAEHIKRYDEFASFLVENNFTVYGFDQRGHGKTAPHLDEIGFLGKNGFNLLVNDLENMVAHLKTIHPNKEIFIFAHSMGSFVTQQFLINNKESVNGVILSGTNGNPGAKINLGILLAKTLTLLRGPKHKSKLLDKLVFGSFNRKYKIPKGKTNWLTRDETHVDRYMNDQYCGTIFSTAYFRDFLSGLKHISKNYHKIPQEVPLLLLSGTDDPVGNYGEGVERLYDDLKKHNHKHLELKLYPQGRHEMINEINRNEVYQDVTNWLTNCIN